MKRKILSITLALSIAFSSIGSISVFADTDWQTGWTGKEGSSDFTVTAEGSTVVMENTKVNNGKFSNDEDSIIYYASELSSDNDFVLSANVNIDSYGTDPDSSNPNQGSVGIGVLDSLYHKTDDLKYDDGIYLGAYAPSKDSDFAITAVTRENSAEKTVGDVLSDSFSTQGEDLGSFDLTIEKTGSLYTLKCGESSCVIEVTALEDEIYPCLYIARNAKATFTDVALTVAAKKAVALSISDASEITSIYGQDLDTSQLTGVITYDDGTTEETNSFLVKNFSSKKLGKQTVTLVSGGAEATIDVNVVNLECTDLNVVYEPIKTVYAKNEALRTEGLQVNAQYSDGTEKTLDSDEYTLSIMGKEIKEGGSLNITGTKNVEVKLAQSKGITSSKSDTFTIEVSPNAISKINVIAPEKTVYYLNDEFDARGMEIEAVYNSASGKEITEVLKSDEYKLSGFDSLTAGTKTITVTSVSNPEISSSFTIEVNERQAEGIVISKYPRTTYAVGEEFNDEDMTVVLKYDNGETEPIEYTVDTSQFNTSAAGATSVTIKAQGYADVELPITVVDEMDNKWRTVIFGQSTDLGTDDDKKVTADEYGTVNGTINVRNWNGTGKITNDQDGITYYYTTVGSESDFKLTADVKINKYLEHDNDDTKRNGQEAFGVMLRDIIPLEGQNGNMVTAVSEAKTDDEGVAVPLSTSEAFASNIAIIGGYSGTGWPTDPSKSSYEKNKIVNRINLLVREGVDAVDGGGTRVGPYAISSDFPAEGNTYKLTVERVNGGIYAKCYNYQTEETMEKYYYDDSFLLTQNSDNYYVGFFGSRWADIDVSNVSFYETSRTTDQTVESAESQTITPQFTFNEKKYSTSDEYTFKLGLTSGVKGRVTVKINGKAIAQDEVMDKSTEFTAKLNPNSENTLVAEFIPSDACNLTSYSPLYI